MASAKIQQLIQDIRAVDKASLSDAERVGLLNAGDELVAKASLPWEQVMRYVWINVTAAGSLKTLVDLKLFEKWVAAGGGVKTSDELAALTGADPVLLTRLLRMLRGVLLLDSPKRNSWALTDFGHELARPTGVAAINYMSFLQYPTLMEMPNYLKTHGYKDPGFLGPKVCAFNDAVGDPGKTLFEHWQGYPDRLADFGNCMLGMTFVHEPWVELFPSQQLVEGLGPDQVAVVDVGGSTGHDLKQFARKHQLAPGKCVLQDMPQVIADVDAEGLLTTQAHDFFQEQPIKGAAAYYLHSVCHDWSDSDAVSILKQIRAAMDPSRSRVLLHEIVLKGEGRELAGALTDVTMMAACNSYERTKEQWAEVGRRAGLKVVDIHVAPLGSRDVIELRAI